MAGMLIKIACVVVACMLVFAPHANAITCGQVTGNLMPCVAYLRSKGPLTAPCCSGVKSLNSAAKTPADKRTACGCIKSVSGTVQGIDAGLAAGLPGKCGVNIPYKISPNTDCNQIQ